MPSNTVKTLRMPRDLADRVGCETERLGITFTDFMLYATRRALGETGDMSFELLKELSAWVEYTFNKDNFPQDVTLRVFHHIRDTQELRGRYERLITRDSGDRDWDALSRLHRRIGRLVKRVLDAEVVARSLPLDPGEHLIKSHALLKPRKTREGNSRSRSR